VISPLVTRPRCTISPGTGACTSRTSTRAADPPPLGRAVIWPASARLAAALRVERVRSSTTSTSVPAPAAGTAAPPTSRPVTVASPAISSYPVNVTGPELSRIAANTEISALPVFFPAASSLARCRWLTISRMEFRLVDGQPLLRGHLKGQIDREAVGVVQLERLVTADRRAPRRLVSSTAASKIAVPVRSVPRKAASSASSTVWMFGASRRSSGYWSPSASIATADSSCR
jgi:hypothetical protein